MKPQALCVLVLVGLTLSNSCCGPKQGYVQREWARTLRELGIVPIFPPREDVMVGDVYVSAYDPDSADTVKLFNAGDKRIGMSPRWSHIDFLPVMEQQYRLRPSGPVTPDEYIRLLTDPTTRPAAEPTTQSLFATESKTVRNRIVGFPEFTSTTFNKGDLSGLIPGEAISLGFGVSGSEFKSVSVKIPSAESIGVDAGYALAELVVEGVGTTLAASVNRVTGRPTGNPGTQPTQSTSLHLKPEYYMGLGSQVDPGKKTVFVRVITEVYYARVVDITAVSKKTGGASLNFKPVSAATQPSTQPTIDPNASPVARAQALNSSLAQSGTLNVPNGSVQFVSANDTSISMRRTFRRPVAFGFRGLTFEVKADDSREIVNVKAAFTEIPMTR